jgi:hypothetical protein
MMNTSRLNLPALAVLLVATAAIAVAWLVPVPDLAAAAHAAVQHLFADPASGTTLAMATLAARKPRAYELGSMNDLPMVASDIIYEGAAVGLQPSTGLARPLTAGDKFVGFSEQSVDNSAGLASAQNVRTYGKGEIQLAVTGAVITDVGSPVYASDDDTFALSPVGGTFIGFVKRFVSAGVVVVGFDSAGYLDPYAARSVREVISANKTLDAEDTGKLFWVNTDAVTITLPAVAAGVFGCEIVNGGAFGTIAVTISPNASDSILGPDITAADDKDLINTKATAKRGDSVVLDSGDADGYLATALRGTWARQA